MSSGRLKPTSANEPGEVGQAIVRAREYRTIQIPRTSVVGRMRLCDRDEAFTAKLAARAYFKSKGVTVDASAQMGDLRDEWNAEIAVQHLAIAVRAPLPIGQESSESAPLATVEEWRECDDDQIESVWQDYESLRSDIDPMSNLDELSAEELEGIVDAAKKADTAMLMSFGSRRLSSCLRSLVSRLPS